MDNDAAKLDQAITWRPTAPEEESLGELAQAKIRFGMLAAMTLFALLAYWHDRSLSAPLLTATIVFTGLSAVGLYFWARLLSGTRENSRWRIGQRVASICVDNISITLPLYLGGETLVGLYGVYLWIIIGYGIRYGLPYLYGNLSASLLGFLVVTQSSPFWLANPSLSIGLGIALLVVPIYSSFLIKRLHTAVRQAHAAYAAKSDFIAKVSHELRTPLHGIIAINDLLSRTSATSQQKEMIRIISVSSNTLLDLINRILDISKFEDGTVALHREVMDLHVVVGETLSILWPQAYQKGLDLRAFIDTTLENHLVGSPRQLQEILINILGNSLKFTERGSVSLRVLSVTPTKRSVGVKIEIQDTGPGIEKDHLARIFEPFYQADDSLTRKHGGTGLGTAIARELVRLMDGEITFESERGIGTTVAIVLEFDTAPRPENLATIYPIEVMVASNAQVANSLNRELAAFGARVIRQDVASLPNENTSSAFPLAIFVDAEDTSAVIEKLRTFYRRNFPHTMIPVFKVCDSTENFVNQTDDSNGVVSLGDGSSTLERALNLATSLRKEYSVQVQDGAKAQTINVLVAEDNATNQTIARLALAEAGYGCTIVNNGEEALEQLASDKFDIAIIDMHMPGMDGLEVARIYNFSHHDPASRIPLVMITADNRPEVMADADLIGVSKFLVKPIKPSSFIETITSLVVAQNSQARSNDKINDTDGVSDDTVWATELINEEIVKELLSYMDNDEKESFFCEFVEDARGYIERFSNIDSSQDLDRLRDEMHALCGAARTVGAKRLAAYARRIVYMGAGEIRQSRDKMRTELDTMLDESEIELRRITGVTELGIA
jgi:two-component system, sensor histidine kinase RpfC